MTDRASVMSMQYSHYPCFKYYRRVTRAGQEETREAKAEMGGLC